MDQADQSHDEVIDLPTGGADLWERVFTVAPLVLVGTRDADGGDDLAPKHQAMPLGWVDHYGFVCTPRHRTFANVSRTGEFTVSFPRPDQVVAVGQAAAPRAGDDKLSLVVLPTRAASVVDAPLAEGAALWLECVLDRVVPGFGEHELVVGRIVAAAAPWWALRNPDVDDAELIADHPQLVHLSPSRFASVALTHSFPFPAEFTR